MNHRNIALLSIALRLLIPLQPLRGNGVIE